MQQLIFASHNGNKAKEIRSVLKNAFEIVTLAELNILQDIPEPHQTIEENAREKATFIHTLTGKNTFGEDTGLEVESLNGEPGVKSARYAGEHKSFEDNITLLLQNLEGQTNRSAQFKTVIHLIFNGKEYSFDGICKGKILNVTRGTDGFGYDPIFIPDGSTKTFAEMTLEEKNQFSHRKIATQKLIDFLKSTIQDHNEN